MSLNLKYFKEIDFTTKMHKLPKKLTPNKLYFWAFLFLFFSFYLGIVTSKVKAQVPSPYVFCDDVRDPEFHSLRPYQKSPCDQEVSQTALFCGNQLVVSDSVSTLQTTLPSLAENCTLIDIDDDKYRCTYNISRSKEVAIDLSDASFPIMGNTENTLNSQSQTDSLDDGEKTNEYVSWYLNGVTNPAEYGFIDPEDEEDISKIIDFSGPINKLLPQRILNDTRVATIEKAGDSRHDQIIGCVTLLGKIVECSQSGANPIRLTDFKKRLPPKEEDYNDFIKYWMAYKRWRGESCLQLPIIGMICIDNPLKPNYWGNLFAEIPLSSTEDRVGLVETETIGVQPVSDDVKISNISFSNQEPAELFFAHMEEVTELAKLLQSTFVSKDGDWSGVATTGVSPTKACDLTNIRSNPGDDLFAGEITGTLSYSAEFSCDFDLDEFIDANSPECKREVLASLSLITETPNADEAWSRLVAGPSGIFKRIFPKVGEGGAILGLLDIPGATNVTYSGDGLVYAGNPGNKRSGESAELYFPHVGGISEYFLKGIQTILRPKGFGEQILSGAPGTFPSSGEINCNQSAPEVSLKGTVDKQAAFQLALSWVSGQTGNHVLECYNDTVKRSKDAGVNPALALWVWLHESNGSNYNITDEDFGVHYGKPEGFVNQINGFLSRAKSYTPSHSACAGKNVTPLEAFAYLYASGTCDPSGTTVGSHTAKDFYDALITQWSWISPGCPLPSSPTDLGCP